MAEIRVEEYHLVKLSMEGKIYVGRNRTGMISDVMSDQIYCDGQRWVNPETCSRAESLSRNISSNRDSIL